MEYFSGPILRYSNLILLGLELYMYILIAHWVIRIKTVCGTYLNKHCLRQEGGPIDKSAWLCKHGGSSSSLQNLGKKPGMVMYACHPSAM